VSRREWIGVALTAIGLAFLAATLGGTGDDAHNDWNSVELTLYVGVSAALGLAAAFASGRSENGGTLLAVSAGLIWGASDVSIKAVSGVLDEGLLTTLLHPLSLVILVASLVGLSVSARSLQVGKAVPVIAVTSAAANVCTIASGPLIFGEPVPDDPLGLAVRIAAFALVIVAASLTPPPIRTPEGDPQPA